MRVKPPSCQLKVVDLRFNVEVRGRVPALQVLQFLHDTIQPGQSFLVISQWFYAASITELLQGLLGEVAAFSERKLLRTLPMFS